MFASILYAHTHGATRKRIYVESQHPAGSAGVLWVCQHIPGIPVSEYVACLFCLPVSQCLPVDAFYSPTALPCHHPHRHPHPHPEAKVCEHKQLLRRIIAIKVRLKWAERPSKRAGFIGLNTWQWSGWDGPAFMHKYEYQYFTTWPFLRASW